MSFDWNSFWNNIVAEVVFFLITIPLAIKFLPNIAVWVLRRRHKRHLSIKYASILIELADFVSNSPFQDNDLNNEWLEVHTPKADLANYRFVTICTVNPFNEMVYPKLGLVVHEYFENLDVTTAYELMTAECDRIKEFRIEIERMLAAHALLIDEKTILEISKLCFDIRKVELEFRFNKVHDELLAQTQSERTSFFGTSKLAETYKCALRLIRDLTSMTYFEAAVTDRRSRG